MHNPMFKFRELGINQCIIRNHYTSHGVNYFTTYTYHDHDTI